MLYNLLIMNRKSGMTITNIQLAEDSISESMGDLASGTLKAIQDVLKELEIGQIKSFETNKKQIIVHKKGRILLALISDIGDNTEVFTPKLQKIAALFDSAVDWDKWSGSIDIFNEQIKKAKNLIKLSEKEIIDMLANDLRELTDSTPEIYGYKINSHSEIVESYINPNLDDFELSSFLKSNFYTPINNNISQIKGKLLKLLDDDDSNQQNFFVDYERISVFLKYYLKDLYVVVFLPGLLDPISDLLPLEQKIIEIGEF